MHATILLTRPMAAAGRLVGYWEKRGVRVCISPLIEPEFEPRAPDLSGIKGLIFTSATAVQAFVNLCPHVQLPAYAVGDATAEAAREAGLDAVSAGGDAEALIRRILADAPEGPLLHVRGRHARGAVAERLSDAGCPTREAVLYTQAEQPLTPQAATLLNGQAPVIVPLFSPRTAEIFSAQHRGAAPILVAAMSAQVAEAVTMEVAKLSVAKQPTMESMLEAIDGLLSAADDLEGH
ncbi:MAG: uroporphyrinogen-III synthase [Sediminimonas qiaohouensis]|uniref:Uroporphyrinogen-III synthase n=1 Tax=Sediminimonas qiaohouensis TaxID=552061 RepID=A0A7C9LP08_9RHOB|nr:uroporphyrinogen-III synthase [Sediminimonas qiaohouensis]MTJ05102.1 uroporphyrinogen-III synthase [Sediminimonas qiaohouensis]